MIGHRTTARGALLLLSIAAAAAAFSVVATGAGAAKVPRIVFPLLSDVPVFDNYGDPRPNGHHAGIDIEHAPRRTPVLAAEAGKVQWHTTSWRAGCMLYLYGASGTTYLYIHLNNDRTLRNDNLAKCGLGTSYTVADGAKVKAGQVIALNGDSGDADGNPHLHFEVHPNDGRDVNPLPFLKKAVRLLFPGGIGTRFALGLRGAPVALEGDRLTLDVTAVRWWPGGRWTPLERTVVLAVDPAASVDPTLASLVDPGERSAQSRKASSVVTVFTATAKVTDDARRGEPGALTAARLTTADGTMVSLVPEGAAPPADGDATEEDPTRPGDGGRGF
jgi:Peptidase family M23